MSYDVVTYLMLPNYFMSRVYIIYVLTNVDHYLMYIVIYLLGKWHNDYEI